jgi:putative NIF3 family GTP cyclohydrolase 1 type 2
VRDRLDAGHVRVTGAREAVVRRVALMPEFLTVSDVRALVAAKLGVNAVICGESCEWEAAVYLKDALDTKSAPVSVIFAGHQPTQAPGVRAMYQWLKQRFPDVPTEFAETARPVRRLEQRA